MAQDAYIRDFAYTAGYYPELAPQHLGFGLFCAGAAAPPVRKMLELGCGQGFGLALLAAANPDLSFEGVDFNAGHIAQGRELADRAGLANLRFEQADFRDLAATAGARDCDLVAAHGVLSWIDADSQRALRDIVSARLKAGGLAMLSYACLPGAAALAPLRQTMRAARRLAPEDAPMALRLGAALLAGLKVGGAAIFAENPALRRAAEAFPTQDPAYLIHDYFAVDARPLSFAETADFCAEAGLAYAASAAVSQNFDPLGPGADLLPDAAASFARETLRDLMANRSFRRDIFVRSPIFVKSTAPSALAAPGFLLAVPPSLRIAEIPAGGDGAARALLAPLLDRLAQGPAEWAGLAGLGPCRAAGPAVLREALALLVEAGQIAPLSCAPPADRAPARRFNRLVVERARNGRLHGHLACPATRGGLAVDEFALLALAAHFDGAGNAEQAAKLGLETVKKLGRRPSAEGAILDGDAEAVAMLRVKLKPYIEHWIPFWRRCGMI